MAKKVLVVDDEVHILRILNYKLSSAGYRVLQATNGRDALEIAHKENPDLIYLDIMMPGLSGFEVLKQLKEDQQTENIPVIILTAKGQESARIQGVEMGGMDYILKPFSPNFILQKTKDVIG